MPSVLVSEGHDKDPIIGSFNDSLWDNILPYHTVAGSSFLEVNCFLVIFYLEKVCKQNPLLFQTLRQGDTVGNL